MLQTRFMIAYFCLFFLRSTHKLVKIIRIVCIYIHIYINVYIDTHEHTLLSIVTGVSKQQDVYACECVWDSSCELKRDNASMIKYSRGRNIHIHCLYLLRETRTRIAPCMIVLYVCIERNSYFPFFLLRSLFLSLSLRCCLYGNNKRWREEEVLYSVYYLVGWFFFRVIILSALHRYLLAFFSYSPEPVRRQATEKRKRPSNRRKEASYFFL